MSSNVNLFSVGQVGAGSTVKAAVRPAVKTGSGQVSDFSQTLDQAQQARNNDGVRPEEGSASQPKDSAADKPQQADGRTQEPDQPEDAGRPEESEGAADAPEGNQADEAQDADADGAGVPETDDKLAAVTAAMAEGNVAVQGQQPLAELGGYFKGDVRLQESAVNPQPLAQQAEAGFVQQAAGGQQEKPLDSLQAVNVMEEMVPVDGDAPSAVKQPASVVQQHAPNSIEALLGSRQAADANALQGRTDNGQQLLNLLPGQRAFAVAQESTPAASESTVSVNQLSELVGQVQVVQTAQDNNGGRGFAQQQNQQGMMNSQGQQQGMQLAGEAAFDVIAPGGDEQANAGDALGQGQQNVVPGFQQALNSVQGTGQAGAPQQAQMPQTAETYNVPQQIVEQARLLQNGQNSEMIIKLNPEHLGELSLKVSVNGNGGVTAIFHTDNHQVRAILETTVIQLKQQLNEQGIKVDSVEVQTSLPDGQLPDGQAQQGFYQQGQGQQVRSRQADLKDFEDASEALAAEPVNNAPEAVHDSDGRLISGGVDYSV